MKELTFADLNDELLIQMAQIDMEIPALYDSEFKYDEKGILNRVEYFKKLVSPFFFKVLMENDAIIAFHVISSFKLEGILAGHIVTLWTHPNYRGQGLAKKLKEDGIEWARTEKMAFIQTGVQNKNQRMQEINKKNGYEEYSVIFRKKL